MGKRERVEQKVGPRTEMPDGSCMGAKGNTTEAADALIEEIQTIFDARRFGMKRGVNFYDEVCSFEIDLIKAALRATGGHQRKAADLLQLKRTTLNSKIKRYNITLIDADSGPVKSSASKKRGEF